MTVFRKVFILSFMLSLVFSGSAKAEQSLTWQSCIEEAMQHHPDLISAEEGVNQSEAGKRISASGLFPQVDANADASRSKSTTVGAGNKASRMSNSFSYGISGRQLLFDGSKTLNNVKSAAENIQAARYNYKFTSSEVRLRLRTAFINVLKAQELLILTKDIYSIRRSNLELITLSYQSGIEHRGALLTAEANLAQSEFEIAQNNRALDVAQRELSREMGRMEFQPLLVEGTFKVSETALTKPDFDQLVKDNPSLNRLIAQRRAASYGIKSAEANYFPQLSAQAGGDRSGATFLPRDSGLNAGVSLSLPLFEGGLRAAEIDQAKSVYHQAQANEQSTKDGIIVVLQQTWAALDDAVETVEVQKKFLDATQERSRIAEAEYSLGLIQFDNWTIIEDDLVSAKKSFLNAQANALLAEANWVQAKGETLENAQ